MEVLLEAMHAIILVLLGAMQAIILETSRISGCYLAGHSPSSLSLQVLQMYRPPPYPPIQDLARPELKLAGKEDHIIAENELRHSLVTRS